MKKVPGKKSIGYLLSSMYCVIGRGPFQLLLHWRKGKGTVGRPGTNGSPGTCTSTYHVHTHQNRKSTTNTSRISSNKSTRLQIKGTISFRYTERWIHPLSVHLFLTFHILSQIPSSNSDLAHINYPLRQVDGEDWRGMIVFVRSVTFWVTRSIFCIHVCRFGETIWGCRWSWKICGSMLEYLRCFLDWRILMYYDCCCCCCCCGYCLLFILCVSSTYMIFLTKWF